MPEQKTANATTLAKRNDVALARSNPWSEMNDLRQRMDDVFSRAFGYTPLSRLMPAEWLEAEPDIDVHETDDRFQVLASLPGYTTSQIQIEATGDSIVVRGERPALPDRDQATTHRDSGLSCASRFQFAYSLPADIDPNKIKATLENGMLRLELPKTEQARAKSVKVPIQGSR